MAATPGIGISILGAWSAAWSGAGRIVASTSASSAGIRSRLAACVIVTRFVLTPNAAKKLCGSASERGSVCIGGR